MAAYYNEFDPKAAAWLRELIKQGLIANVDVDERSIVDVQPSDVRDYDQCHWFAGIGGWSYALRLAGISDGEPLWTASLPCQPFSVAGKGLGKDDERHLLPHFIELVRQSKPKRIFGEQVEGAVRHGWLDDLQAAMEAEGYAVGAAVLGAHSVGSYHQRQRLYWVADSGSTGSQRHGRFVEIAIQAGRERAQRHVGEGSELDWMADPSNGRCESFQNQRSSELFNSANGAKKQKPDISPVRTSSSLRGKGFGMGNADSNGCESRSKTAEAARHWSSADATGWTNPDWLECRDNKFRPIESGLEPLVNGISKGVVPSRDPDCSSVARVMRLQGYGNAIVPQVAAEFIGAFYEHF